MILRNDSKHYCLKVLFYLNSVLINHKVTRFCTVSDSIIIIVIIIIINYYKLPIYSNNLNIK